MIFESALYSIRQRYSLAAICFLGVSKQHPRAPSSRRREAPMGRRRRGAPLGRRRGAPLGRRRGAPLGRRRGATWCCRCPSTRHPWLSYLHYSTYRSEVFSVSCNMSTPLLVGRHPVRGGWTSCARHSRARCPPTYRPPIPPHPPQRDPLCPLPQAQVQGPPCPRPHDKGPPCPLLHPQDP